MTDTNGAGARPLTDIEVAQFLTEFRDRPQAQQESSPVWQELSGFPQWAGAQYRGDAAPSLPAPPDPRLPGLERRAEMERQGTLAPPTPPSGVHVSQQPDGARAMTTGDVGRAPNPWAEYNPPANDGSGVWRGVNTDVPPPWPGKWVRRQGGWWREPN